ncbi:MAG: hypothetical protein GY757_00345, partial [bacterium]|nr:hypothetical protein [bacterium]
VYRVDRLTQLQLPVASGENGNTAGHADNTGHYLQVESRKMKAWNFFDNGERHVSSVSLTGKTGEKSRVINPLLTLSFQVNDKSTHNGELKNGYIGFINQVARNDRFIDFNPTCHTLNGLWGSTQLVVKMDLNKKGITNLLEAGEEKIWRGWAEVSGKPVDYWQRKLVPKYRRGRPV